MEAPLLPAILVVDDNPDDLFLTKRLLLKAGARNGIVPLTGGAEAITYLKAAALSEPQPGLVFLDIKMPDVDGFEVLHWARKQRLLRGLAIYMLSGSDEPQDRQRAADLGANGYLVKHPTHLELKAVLRAH
jgi:two-component system, response regulator